MADRRGRRRRMLAAVTLVAAVIVSAPLVARTYMWLNARGRVYTDIDRVPKQRVAMVLGAGVRPNGRLSPSLEGRMKTAVDLYKAGKVRKLLMSGDNRFSHYNEPQRMRDYAIGKGVPAQDIVCDYAGRRTYDSVYRAKRIFGIDEMIVVSQGYHLDRSLFLADHIGVNACGVAAPYNSTRSAMREIPACLGAMVDVYLRHPHPVMGRKENI